MKRVYQINIVIVCNDETGFVNTIDEVVNKLKQGYVEGADGNEDEEYSFDVKKNDH